MYSSVSDRLVRFATVGFRFKEEAEGAIAELKEQVAGAHQERHALEQQAKDQVWLLHLSKVYLRYLGQVS